MSVCFFTYPLCMIRAKCILQNTSFFHLIGETSMHHLLPFLPTTLTALDEIPIFELSIDFKITCHFAKIHFEKNMFNIIVHYKRCFRFFFSISFDFVRGWCWFEVFYILKYNKKYLNFIPVFKS